MAPPAARLVVFTLALAGGRGSRCRCSCSGLGLTTLTAGGTACLRIRVGGLSLQFGTLSLLADAAALSALKFGTLTLGTFATLALGSLALHCCLPIVLFAPRTTFCTPCFPFFLTTRLVRLFVFAATLKALLVLGAACFVGSALCSLTLGSTRMSRSPARFLVCVNRIPNIFRICRDASFTATAASTIGFGLGTWKYSVCGRRGRNLV